VEGWRDWKGWKRHNIYFLGHGGRAQEAMLPLLSDLEYSIVFQLR
jgi:hypothetical protein